jgi:peptidoglycan/LPS O-acetylase OafA/YrhL
MTPNVKNYLTTLTPLRGIAALVVAVYHFEVVARFVAPESSMFLRKGYLMVDLFFILSGFIMLHVYGATFQNRITRPDLGNFWWPVLPASTRCTCLPCWCWWASSA